jgi:hypothetical protein
MKWALLALRGEKIIDVSFAIFGMKRQMPARSDDFFQGLAGKVEILLIDIKTLALGIVKPDQRRRSFAQDAKTLLRFAALSSADGRELVIASISRWPSRPIRTRRFICRRAILGACVKAGGQSEGRRASSCSALNRKASCWKPAGDSTVSPQRPMTDESATADLRARAQAFLLRVTC